MAEEQSYQFDSIEHMQAHIASLGPLRDGVPIYVAGERFR
jgi:hypothetical protein